MSVESKDDNKQVIRGLLEEKEAMIAHGPKGRMIVRRPRKSKTDKENIIKIRDGICGPHKTIGPRTTFGPHRGPDPPVHLHILNDI